MLDELFWLRSHRVEIEVLVGPTADEDFVDVFRIGISVLAEAYTKCIGECVDEKIKKLIFRIFHCLLGDV